jgi:hypothetical protein
VGKAKPIEVKVAGGVGATTVTMKALYDDENIYFFVRWLDETRTESVRINAWIYEGGKWKPYHDPVTGRDEEDRFAIQWDLGVEGFAEMGCLVLCHAGDPNWPEPGSRMHTSKPGERTDEWHWKAARSNPLGIFHDKYIDHTVDPEDVEAGHHGDGPGFYTRNRNKEKTDNFISGIKRAILRYYATLKIYAFIRERTLLLAIVYSSMLYISFLMIAPSLLKAFGSDQPFLELAFHQLGLLYAIFISPTPGGSGVGELGALATFSSFLPVYQLGVFAILWRLISQYISAFIGGIILFVFLYMDSRKYKHNAKN